MKNNIAIAERVLRIIEEYEHPTIKLIHLKDRTKNENISQALKSLVSLDILNIKKDGSANIIYPSKNFYSAVKSDSLDEWIREKEEKQILEKELVKATLETHRRTKVVSILTLIVAIVSTSALIFNSLNTSKVSDLKVQLNKVEKKIESYNNQRINSQDSSKGAVIETSVDNSKSKNEKEQIDTIKTNA